MNLIARFLVGNGPVALVGYGDGSITRPVSPQRGHSGWLGLVVMWIPPELRLGALAGIAKGTASTSN
jgi:hypothetical protein